MRILVNLLVFGMLLIQAEVFACTCVGENTVKKEMKYVDAVVIGKVVSKELVTLTDSSAFERAQKNNWRSGLLYERIFAMYKVVVSARCKGIIPSDTLNIYTGLGRGDCRYPFTVGSNYIIYGMKKAPSGQGIFDFPFPKGKNTYWTNICRRTTSVNPSEITEITEIEQYLKEK
ncbi:MAG: hypothetical protein AAGI38_08255 [Bacteroidota bacterium]